METYGLKREHLAMVAVLMSRQAMRHPRALTRREYTLEEVMTSQPIAPHINLLECARRADGGAALVLASANLLRRKTLGKTNRILMKPETNVSVLGGGEASGPLYPPPIIDETMFSCEEAIN